MTEGLSPSKGTSSLGLYLHIPFCQALCSYCNFNRGLFDRALKARYVSALTDEIRNAGDGRVVDTIFFGGGTPSLLEPAEVASLLDACRDVYRVASASELTLESNPETATEERLRGFRDAGINRISFGVQSFDNSELARLGRIHSAERAVEAVGDARRAGFANVSLDLMCWLPGQSRESWRRTVRQAIAVGPDHLSLYLLELYPNAPLKEAMARAVPAASSATTSGEVASWAQASDDEAADMYLEGLAQLDHAGYAQYEISNVARPDRASRHNLKYWQAQSWRGFGCGAHSTVDGVRWKNVSSTAEYVDRMDQGAAVAGEHQRLSMAERASEALFTGLRLSYGIDNDVFAERFGFDPWHRYGGTLVPHVEAGLVWETPRAFGLTRQGMLLANEILVEFV